MNSQESSKGQTEKDQEEEKEGGRNDFQKQDIIGGPLQNVIFIRKTGKCWFHLYQELRDN